MKESKELVGIEVGGVGVEDKLHKSLGTECME